MSFPLKFAYDAIQDGVTPLYMASHNGHEEVVRLLTDQKACNVNLCKKVLRGVW